MSEMNDEIKGFFVELTDDEVRTLYYAVQRAIEMWPGSPARPAEEQERLWAMRDGLFKMILEISLEA